MLDRMPIGSPALMIFALLKVFAYHIEFNPYCHFVIRSFRITYFQVEIEGNFVFCAHKVSDI